MEEAVILFFRTSRGIMLGVGPGLSLYVLERNVMIATGVSEERHHHLAGPFDTPEEAEVVMQELIDAAIARSRGER
jgi:hypothetical protein